MSGRWRLGDGVWALVSALCCLGWVCWARVPGSGKWDMVSGVGGYGVWAWCELAWLGAAWCGFAWFGVCAWARSPPGVSRHKQHSCECTPARSLAMGLPPLETALPRRGVVGDAGLGCVVWVIGLVGVLGVLRVCVRDGGGDGAC